LGEPGSRCVERRAEFEALKRQPMDEADAGAAEVFARLDADDARHILRGDNIDVPQPTMSVI
jgi:hypothetical protein